MARWEFAIAVEKSEETPFFLQIARSVAEGIRRGRLRPGDRLPGTRSLAESLNLNRNTVVAAYAELASEGWITMSAAKGTFISKALPDPKPRSFGPIRSSVPTRVGFDLGEESTVGPDPPLRPDTLRFDTGTPDLREFPLEALARAYRRALKASGRRALGYFGARNCHRDGAYGHVRLREALSAMLASTRGLAAAPETVLVTRGSQMALAVLARTLVRPGDVVAVEELGSRPVWEAMRAAGARVVPLPLDGDGVQLPRIEELASSERLRAVYITPHHQHPTTVTLCPGRRMQLLELARQRRFAIIEDDYDHEFHYEGRPILPIASVDTAGVVVYVGTLSKILAPGLRIGYVVAPEKLIDRMAEHRIALDIQGDLAVEAAVAEMMEDGEIARHVRRTRRIYQRRRDILAEELKRQLGDVLTFRVPNGGMGLWARVRAGIDVERWAERAEREGTTFFTGRFFAMDGRPRPFLRLGFTSLGDRQIVEGVARLSRALPRD